MRIPTLARTMILASALWTAGTAAAYAASHKPVRPVRVAVIDGGVVMTASLAASVETEIDMAGNRAPYTAVSDHGTAVSTIVARTAHGPVRIVSLRVDKTGVCDGHLCEMEQYAIVSAIYKAIELRVDVINMSIDLTYDRTTYNALTKAAKAGISIIVAAGNQGGEPRSILYARSMPKKVWLVGATDDQGRPTAFSARVDGECGCQFVWRHGIDVETQNRAGERVYGSGTSMAAPLMTAEIADAIGAKRR